LSISAEPYVKSLSIGDMNLNDVFLSVWRCKLKYVECYAVSAWCQRLKLSFDRLLSTFAFKISCRRYMSATSTYSAAGGGAVWAFVMNGQLEYSTDASLKVGTNQPNPLYFSKMGV